MSNVSTKKLGDHGFNLSDVSCFNTQSTLAQLSIFSSTIELDQTGKVLSKLLEGQPNLPGVILCQKKQFYGMISRTAFLSQMSKPYSLDLFYKRTIKQLLEFIPIEYIVFSEHSLIIDVVERALQRSTNLIYEPIVVHRGDDSYGVIDIYQLLIAQGKIHHWTSHRLDQESSKQLIQTEKMAELGRMVAGIAHEMRNPLNAIHGNLEFINEYTGDLLNLLESYRDEFPSISPRLKEQEQQLDLDFLMRDLDKILRTIKLSSKRLIELVNGLGNFSRLDDGKPNLINVHECLDGTLLILNNRLKKGITLTKKYDHNLPEIKAFMGQLSQVFMNIISNAIDTLNDKAKTNLNQPWEPEIQIVTSVVNLDDRNAVEIAITDNGMGIPEEIESKIFQTFFTTKEIGKGTGLGLAISYQIITERHQGELSIQTEFGKGTTFNIIVPVNFN